MRDEVQQNADMAIGNGHDFAAARHAPCDSIDDDVVEGVGGHGSIIRGMKSAPLRWLWAFGFGLWALGSPFSTPLLAADKTTAGELITEPPTLLSLGFEWRIEGDDNRNA
jgi:hypothetical protein